jgi:hypothetical protein
MVEGQRMTPADVVAQVRDGRLEDFVREAVVLVARELMEADRLKPRLPRQRLGDEVRRARSSCSAGCSGLRERRRVMLSCSSQHQSTA